MAQFDITLASTNPVPEFATASYRIAEDYQQDITPASTRRSDGDARYRLIETESYWGQTDWAGGFGLVFPPDPTSYQDGPVDALTPHRLRAAYAPTTITVQSGYYPLAMCRHNGNVYCYFTDVTATVAALYRRSGAAWSLETASGLVAGYQSVSMVSYRGKLWISFGAAQTLRTWDGSVLATPTNAPYADRLCPFGSMLFYIRYDSTTQTHRVNRYDPENTGSIPDLAILPVSFQSAWQGRSLAALGSDLYIVIAHQLWRFTSSNGNSGILEGPLDTWVPTGSATTPFASCSCIAVYRGGLYYSAGSVLRRYYPGGQPETVFPDISRVTSPLQTSLMVNEEQIWALEVAEDRLWLGMTRAGDAASFYTNEPVRLLCWDGIGAHHVGSLAGLYSGSLNAPGATGQYGCYLVADGTGVLVSFLRHPSDPATSGARCGYYQIGGTARRLYKDGSVWKGSRNDYGLLDIEKAVSAYGVAAVVPSGMDLSLSVVVDGATYAMVKQGSFSATYPTIVYFTPPGGARVLVGKVFEPQIRFDTGSGDAAQSPEVWSIHAIPNPLNPLRRGFRFTILLDEAVLDHTTGARLYADEAAVASALAAIKAYRNPAVTRHPIALTWVDGQVYYVRVNTQTIRRVATQAGGRAAYRVTCDAQEIT